MTKKYKNHWPLKKKKKKICILNKEVYPVSKDEKTDRKAEVW